MLFKVTAVRWYLSFYTVVGNLFSMYQAGLRNPVANGNEVQPGQFGLLRLGQKDMLWTTQLLLTRPRTKEH